ncbi:hypothetical protein DESUT3_37580 [Desulfuromonas versatilis]|uniref:Fibronectin type-III domain-containing protein n=1 Tax=Desulfuromonas versatilis TaxID=2802975 RepID=A0ABN6E3E0_9BACT|nr:hypothetical protein [Desulfuromonas versatilis]BCR06689.1 hypothetical protein DESUT3_37580 [Desulfuromonas versatilis]
MHLKTVWKKSHALFWSILLLLLLTGTGPAFAALKDFGPINPDNGYPVWYRDFSSNVSAAEINFFQGLPLQLCDSKALSPSPAGGFMCNLLPEDSDPAAGVPGFVPENPTVFPADPFADPPVGNFPGESFWWSADALFTSGGIDASLTLGLEAAFAGTPLVNGTQISFGRVRIRIDTPIAGDYRVTHPYGVQVFRNVPAGTRTINFTDDIGIGGQGDFSGALASAIGPFLRWDTEFPVVVGLPPNEEYFVGDPNVEHTVTGSPFGTNFFRVERIDPGNNDAVLQAEQTDLFSITGKIYTTPISSALKVERASYSRDNTQALIAVFASASVDSNVPGTPSSLEVSGANLPTTTMTTDGAGNFFSHLLTPPNSLPGTLFVTNTSDNPPTVVEVSLVDEVAITEASYDPTTEALTVKATSSDQLVLPMLTTSFGDLTGGQASFTNVLAPPAKVTVSSSAGGDDSEMVTVSIIPPEILAVVSPNGNETLTGGDVFQVQWSSHAGATRYLVRYSINGGASWLPIANVEGTSFDWTVPSADSANCLIRVTAYDAGGAWLANDVSDNPFTIAPGTPPSVLAVVSPNGNEALTSGATHLIQWSAPAGAASYLLRYSVNGGANWLPIVSTTGTSYLWTVPAANSSNCLLRITAYDAGGSWLANDVSNAPFGITP